MFRSRLTTRARASHARALAVAAGAAAVLAITSAQAHADEPVVPETPETPETPEVAYRFVSMPDFFNADLGDVSGLPGWEPGEPNSINEAYAEAIDTVLASVKRDDPAFVTVAGDLVEGHWGRDADGTGIFGPVETEEERLSAVTAAGNLYYGQWRENFAMRELPVYAGLGDHDIGDNRWAAPPGQGWPAGSFRHLAVPTFKEVWAQHFTKDETGAPRFPLRPVGTPWEDTAYAIEPDPETLMVFVDVFRHNGRGVQPVVAGGQLRWLRALLEDAKLRGVDNVIVQGHVPVLGPVRSRNSSGLHILRGGRSQFWRLLEEMEVDMYLCGEVHAVTAIDDGVLQVCHGGLITRGTVNYMLVTVYDGGTIDLEVKRFWRTWIDRGAQLWQTNFRRHPIEVAYAPRPVTTATGRLGPAGFTEPTGRFRPYAPRAPGPPAR